MAITKHTLRYGHGHCDSKDGPRSRTYNSWAKMKARCTNANERGYAHYGGRGITVCERWNDFRNFLADMGERPDNTSLDRIDNDKGYSPENCRWADRHTQAMSRRKPRTRRGSVLLTAFGESKWLSEWAKDPRCVVVQGTLEHRIRRGWPHPEAIIQPVSDSKRRSDRASPK